MQHAPFDPEVGTLILDLYTEGTRLGKICLLEGMPRYGVLLRWIRDNPEFSADFERARRARALHLEEETSELLEGDLSEKEVPHARLKFDVLRWQAEVADPSRYGKKVTVGGDPGRPIVLTVVTNVPPPLEHQKPPELDITGLAKAITPVAAADLQPPEPVSEPDTLFDRLSKNPGMTKVVDLSPLRETPEVRETPEEAESE